MRPAGRTYLEVKVPYTPDRGKCMASRGENGEGVVADLEERGDSNSDSGSRSAVDRRKDHGRRSKINRRRTSDRRCNNNALIADLLFPCPAVYCDGPIFTFRPSTPLKKTKVVDLPIAQKPLMTPSKRIARKQPNANR